MPSMKQQERNRALLERIRAVKADYPA